MALKGVNVKGADWNNLP